MDINKVIEENIKLIYKVAARFAKGDKDLNDEYVQTAFLRVHHAINKRYNPDKSAISTFITNEATWAVQDFIKDNSTRVYIPHNIRELKAKIYKYEEDKNSLTAEYVSKKYGVSFDIAISALDAFKSNSFLDRVISDKDGNQTNVADLIECNTYSTFVDPIVKEKLKSLKGRDKVIIAMLLDGYSYQKIADRIGISQSRVGILVKDLRKKLEWMKGGVYACL